MGKRFPCYIAAETEATVTGKKHGGWGVDISSTEEDKTGDIDIAAATSRSMREGASELRAVEFPVGDGR